MKFIRILSRRYSRYFAFMFFRGEVVRISGENVRSEKLYY